MGFEKRLGVWFGGKFMQLENLQKLQQLAGFVVRFVMGFGVWWSGVRLIQSGNQKKHIHLARPNEDLAHMPQASTQPTQAHPKANAKPIMSSANYIRR